MSVLGEEKRPKEEREKQKKKLHRLREILLLKAAKLCRFKLPPEIEKVGKIRCRFKGVK